MKIKVALIITTFDSCEMLESVLQSVLVQNLWPSEVIIADDGSQPTTRDLISRWGTKLPIVYVWQKNSGFRAAAVRNLAILKSRFDYLIFIDGDCVLPRSFVQSHVELARESKIVSGGRLLIDSGRQVGKSISAVKSFKLWRLPLGVLRDVTPRKWSQVRTCNVSLFKKAALKVFGFDESYVGWGREDSDFVVRLLRVGQEVRSARFAATVIHMYHPRECRSLLSLNDARFSALLKDPSRAYATESRLSNL